MSNRDFLERQPKPLIIGIAALVMLLIGLCDLWSGWELSLFVLYAGPIALVVWCVSLRWGLVFAGLAAVTWFLANEQTHPYVTQWGYPVATFSRLSYFVFVAVGIGAMKERRDADAATIVALKRSRDLENEIVKVSEREQRRIGQDLHDGLCQTLAAIGCAATALKDDLEPVTEAGHVAAAEIETLLKGAVVEARSLARGISPVHMNENGLSAALEDFADMTSHLTRVDVSYAGRGDTDLHDQQTGMHLYRIAQEAVNNAIRHGKANHVEILLAEQGAGMVLSVSDDGCGMGDSPRESSGMGIASMRYRAEQAGADLKIGVASTGGVRVVCVLPQRREGGSFSDA